MPIGRWIRNRSAFARWTRRCLLAGALLYAWWALRDHGIYSLAEQDTSMEPLYPSGSRLWAVDLDGDEPLERGWSVVYAVQVGGEKLARFGRVVGVAGDVVDLRDGILWIGGRSTGLSATWDGGPARIGGEPPQRVPEGMVVVLNVNALERRYGDSRQFGFIPRGDVVARIRARIAF